MLLLSPEPLKFIKLPKDSVRGGILTQGSILKVTANGTTSSPVLRGLWVLENIMGQPSLPPPAGVPAVEPDIRGSTTIREQLDKHRADESCARCHKRIDPPGFALEVFDPIGGYRSKYRTLGPGEKVPVHKSYRLGQLVDASGKTHKGQAFNNFKEFKTLLLKDEDLFTKCLIKKLMVYATGRPLSLANSAEIELLVQKAKEKGNGLKTLIHLVVQSDLFLQP